ncbi:MAG: LysE/ArgO family amino acid transporter, partial [Candidatus Puniceispirillaceae bacterium]
FCAIADMALIVVGVGGLSLLVADVAARYEAALFGLAAMWLAGYGVMRLRRAIRANAAIKADAAGSDSLAAVLTTGAVLTFGNPHVYLDTVVLLGTVSVRFTGMDKLAYGTGAATASFVFFFALGYGASLLAPQMQRPNAWRVLDTIIAVVMFALAIGMARAGGWLGA